MSEYSVSLASLPMPGPWARSGRCRSVPPNVMFPTRGAEGLEDARRVCALCPVNDDCLEYALTAPDLLQGVWAGTTQVERRELRRQRAEPTEPVSPAPERNFASPAGTLASALEELAAHPGRWARIAHFQSVHSASAIASRLRNGQLWRPGGEWQFEGRVSEGGGSDLYALLVEEAEVAAS